MSVYNTKKVGGKVYTFRLGFEVIRRIQEDYGIPAFELMQRAIFNKNAVKPVEMLRVIEASIEKIDGEDVRGKDLEPLAMEFIDLAGYSDAMELMHETFVWGELGDVQKKRIQRASLISRVMKNYLSSLWQNSGAAGALWVATLLISTTLTCLILMILDLLGWL